VKYIASPYSHQSVVVRQQRFEQARRFTDWAMRQGHVAFSPIVYAHQFAVEYNHGTDFRYWLDFNEHMLLVSDALWLLKLDGWEESRGVAHEIAFAEKNGIRVIEHEVFV